MNNYGCYLFLEGKVIMRRVSVVLNLGEILNKIISLRNK